MAETKKKTTTTRKKKPTVKKPVEDTGAMQEFVELMTGKPVSEIKVDVGKEDGDKTVETVYAKLDGSIKEIEVNMTVTPSEATNIDYSDIAERYSDNLANQKYLGFANTTKEDDIKMLLNPAVEIAKMIAPIDESEFNPIRTSYLKPEIEVNNEPVKNALDSIEEEINEMAGVSKELEAVVGGNNAPIPGMVESTIYTKPEAADAVTEVLSEAIEKGETASPLPSEIDDMVRQEHEDLIEGKDAEVVEEKKPIFTNIVYSSMGIKYDE